MIALWFVDVGLFLCAIGFYVSIKELLAAIKSVGERCDILSKRIDLLNGRDGVSHIADVVSQHLRSPPGPRGF